MVSGRLVFLFVLASKCYVNKRNIKKLIVFCQFPNKLSRWITTRLCTDFPQLQYIDLSGHEFVGVRPPFTQLVHKVKCYRPVIIAKQPLFIRCSWTSSLCSVECLYRRHRLWLCSVRWIILRDIYRVHYDDVIITTMASQITSLTVVYSIVY